MDRGIQWDNNDFRNPDGTTRIEEIFDLTDNTGANAPNNPYKAGTIPTRQQIDAALASGTPLAIATPSATAPPPPASPPATAATAAIGSIAVKRPKPASWS